MLHLKNNTLQAAEDHVTLTNKDEVAALVMLRESVQAPRQHPLSGANPLSYWSGCFIRNQPESGRLVELVMRCCGLVIDLADLAPLLKPLAVIEWLDVSENFGVTGDCVALADSPATLEVGPLARRVHFAVMHCAFFFLFGNSYSPGFVRAWGRAWTCTRPRSAATSAASRRCRGCAGSTSGQRRLAGRCRRWFPSPTKAFYATWTSGTAPSTRRTAPLVFYCAHAVAPSLTIMRGCPRPAPTARSLEGIVPARFERAVRLTLQFEGTELVREDLVASGKVMPKGYFPPSHPIHRPAESALSVW